MTKEEQLAKLEAEAREELKVPGTNLVFGEGNPDARIMMIGEAPGFHEDRLGRPFVGQAGKVLDRMMDLAGIKRSDVYITNVLKTRPPGNRDPEPEEMEQAARFLDGQIQIVDPEVVVTLGRFSMAKFMPGVKITQVHGVPKRVGRRVVVPMFHPAAALRARAVMTLLEEDFAKLPGILANVDQVVGEGTDPNQLSLM
ncbi:MAG TPA: uracil-DNA glycosylase [Patescibacteria group bacterium]|nr:uracil-DNA glycosylase [Patescibacteria group bacterium]